MNTPYRAPCHHLIRRPCAGKFGTYEYWLCLLCGHKFDAPPWPPEGRTPPWPSWFCRTAIGRHRWMWAGETPDYELQECIYCRKYRVVFTQERLKEGP